MKKRDDLTSYVVTTFDCEETYSKIMSEVNKKDYSDSVLNIINPVMDSYKKDSKLFIRDFMDFLIELIGDLDVEYESMTDDKYLESFADFPEDVRRIQNDFLRFGFNISSAEAEMLWIDVSDVYAAQWLGVDHDDKAFMDVFFIFCKKKLSERNKETIENVFVIGSLSQWSEIKEIAIKYEHVKYVHPQPPSKPFAQIVSEVFDNIDEADVIIALRKPDGSIGQGITYEIEYAKRLNKKILYVDSVVG